jgi:NitT/TauT family transport system substrate-binding protein
MLDAKPSCRRRFAVTAVMSIGLLVLSCSRPATVTVETEPPGSTVTVDGTRVGVAPVKAQVQPEGSTIVVLAPGREAAQAPSSSKGLRIVRTAYVPLTAYLPLYVALENKYFERYGVRVEATEANSPNDILTGIASGKLDFAAALAYTILFPGAIQYPDSFELFSSSEETSTQFTSSVIAKRGSPLTSYQQLRGKRIGVYQGLVQVIFLKAMLEGMGIAPSEVEIVEISPRLQIQGLVAGEYDALSSTEPTVNVAVLQGLAQVVAENPRTRFIMRPFPSTAAAISTKLLREEPEAARGVVAALDLAIEFIRTNPDAAKKILPKYTPIPENIEARVLDSLKLFKYCKLGEENRLNVQRFADYLFETKLLGKQISDVNVLFGDYEPVKRRAQGAGGQ